MPLLESIGHASLLALERLFIKLECSNPGGRVKDRIARFMLQEAMHRGELEPGDVVVETTSGNTGIVLTLVGREMGLRVLIFMPKHMTVDRRTIIQNLGAEVRLIPKEEGFLGAITMRDACRGRPGYYVPDQFGNPDNTLCHRNTTGREVLAQLEKMGCRRIDCLVAGVGTAEAHAEAVRIRTEHGDCVGMSAGANMVASLRLEQQGATVVTLWPDCANRYVSVGLKPPSSSDFHCDLRADCEARSRSLLSTTR